MDAASGQRLASIIRNDRMCDPAYAGTGNHYFDLTSIRLSPTITNLDRFALTWINIPPAHRALPAGPPNIRCDRQNAETAD
jgi:hypothetical protein